MLEQPTLLLGPWPGAPGKRTGQGRREISVPATGQYLGHVHGSCPLGWWSWLAARTLEVLETEDASLVMTVRRPWGPARAWTVFDAEERRVGILYRHVLLDGSGQRLATVHSPAVAHGRFLDPWGTELGAFERREQSIVLSFSDILEGKPFERMILLGAVLSWD